MMKETLARPYAAAAFALAKKKKILETVSTLLALGAAIANQAVFQKHYKNPSCTPEYWSAMFISLVLSQKKKSEKAADPDEATGETFAKAFFHSLALNRRLFLLPVIVQLYEKARAQDENRMDVQLTEAAESSSELKEALKTFLSQVLKKNITFIYKIDPAILGGIVLRWEDKVIDMSFKRKLENSQKIMHSAGECIPA